MRRLIYLAAVAVALTVMTGVAALGGRGTAQAADPQLEKAITDTMEAAVADYNAADFDKFTAHFTDRGFEAEFEMSRAEAKNSDEVFGDPLTMRSLHDINATATGATAIVEFVSGLGVQAEELSYVKQGNGWLIDRSKPASAAVDPGTTVVDLGLQEYAFDYDAAALQGGDVAFKVTNTGKEPHEVLLAKVDDSLTASSFIDELARSGESGPPPFEDFGYLGMVEPGTTITAALAHPLEPGTYVFFCAVTGADGTPHFMKGMVSEFKVGAGGSSIAPPSTGDGGLLP
jgi:hypothetical protein